MFRSKTVNNILVADWLAMLISMGQTVKGDWRLPYIEKPDCEGRLLYIEKKVQRIEKLHKRE